MRVIKQTFAISLSASALVGLPAMAANDGLSLAFPIVIEAPDVTPLANVKSGEPIFTQRFRSLSAAELISDYLADYKPTYLVRRVANGNVRHVPFVAGSVFVVAQSPIGEIYCAAGADRSPDWQTFFDVAVCFRDVDSDGIFDEQLVDEPDMRVRTAYEMSLRKPPGWTPIKVAYRKLTGKDVPAGEFSLRYEYRKGLLGSAGFVQPMLCAPPRMLAPVNDKSDSARCGITNWKLTPEPPLKTAPVLLRAATDATNNLSWGPVQTEIVVHSNGLADVLLKSGHSPGPSTLVALWATGNYKEQTTTFGILSKPSS